MKLTTQTVQILKNYATINPSILIRQGNVLRTTDPSGGSNSYGSIISKAVVEETFEKDFAIYDLSRLLSTLSMFKDPDITVEDTHLLIKEDNREVKYTLVNPELIVSAPDKDANVSEIVSEFNLTGSQLSEVMKAMSILNMKELGIVADGSNLTIQTQDSKNNTSDVYSVTISETDQKFKAVLNLENLRLISSDYKVSVSSKGYVSFSNSNMDYFIACDRNLSNFY